MKLRLIRETVRLLMKLPLLSCTTGHTSKDEDSDRCDPDRIR